MNRHILLGTLNAYIPLQQMVAQAKTDAVVIISLFMLAVFMLIIIVYLFVSQLVAEIASASSEQAKGIDQINRAVTEMDKVIQQNAANAEQCAATSEEMELQSGKMKGVVRHLMGLIKGGDNGSGSIAAARVTKSAPKKAAYPPTPVKQKREKFIPETKKLEFKKETHENDFEDFELKRACRRCEGSVIPACGKTSNSKEVFGPLLYRICCQEQIPDNGRL